tara:strand:+ start:6658 stop:6864 length:207 start_codon:yes stop_codon:yes gene_type:complete
MRILEEAKGYKTQANAIKAFNKQMGEDFLKGQRWTMTVNYQGRFLVSLIGPENMWNFHRANGRCGILS